MELNVLADLGPALAEVLSSNCIHRRFSRRQALFHVGDPNDGMYIVESGRVVVQLSTPGGEVASLVIVGPGQSVGEQSLLLEQGRRSATALALDPVMAMFLSRDRFLELRAGDRAFDQVMIRLLTLRVLRLTDQLVEARYVPATTRVLRRIVEAAEMYGDGTIPLTQDELASLAGSTRHTANRVLRSAVDIGAIELSRGRITVVNLGALLKLAE